MATAAAAAGAQAWRRSRETKQTWAAATDPLPETPDEVRENN
ncbi:MAG: hypothetical protein Q4G34_07650 [Micrococcus sp.]|nr:hypothetical protein [Micrococcus sp.]